VCNQIAALHKGTITLQSEEQKGTAVTVTLPLSGDSQNPSGPGRDPADPAVAGRQPRAGLRQVEIGQLAMESGHV